jgi:hypothetical protein
MRNRILIGLTLILTVMTLEMMIILVGMNSLDLLSATVHPRSGMINNARVVQQIRATQTAIAISRATATQAAINLTTTTTPTATPTLTPGN